jgi:hypothetical protein
MAIDNGTERVPCRSTAGNLRRKFPLVPGTGREWASLRGDENVHYRTGSVTGTAGMQRTFHSHDLSPLKYCPDFCW